MMLVYPTRSTGVSDKLVYGPLNHPLVPTRNWGRPRAVILIAEKPSTELPPTGYTDKISLGLTTKYLYDGECTQDCAICAAMGAVQPYGYIW